MVVKDGALRQYGAKMEVYPPPGFDDFFAAIGGFYVYECIQVVKSST
jgi:hypothetical protein